MTNHTPIDQPQRQRALDTTRSFAVSAPAGSGKTGLLTQRVLALLALCDEPENVLAITFTRKAAAEMQARILEALHEAHTKEEEPAEEYQQVTWRLAKAVLKRNEEKGWELFNCPNRLRITTIDSLCRSISQQMPFESQLGDTPEILDNVNTAYELAARDTLALLDKDNDLQPHLIRLVQHFDNRLERIETLFMQLLAKRDQWLGVLFQTKNQRQVLEAMLAEVIEEHLHNTSETLIPIASELAILADHGASNSTSDSAIYACKGLMGLPSASTQAIPQWLGIAELLLTQKGELRKSATKAIGFLAPSDKSLSKEEQAIAKAYKQRMADLLEQCSDPDYKNTLETTLHQIRSLPAAAYHEKQWQLLDSLTHILLVLAQNLTLAFQQLGKADYLAVTLAALDALGEPDNPSDLALALDYKIQHILIDEFQDTSTTQMELLQRLTAGWQSGNEKDEEDAGDGRTLFIVGDAMQSCYRFRDANVGIFLDVRQYGLGDIRLEPLDLQVNFRSQQCIVDWVNDSFTDIFPEVSNSHRGAVRYSPSTSVKPALTLPAVQSYLLAYHDKLPHRKTEADTVVSIVQQTQAERPSDSIALLVRSKAHAQDIISGFNAANIAYQATDIDRLNTCMPVLDCLSLTKAMLYPNDRLAWLAVLRAPWCGLDMQDLLTISTWQAENDAENKVENKEGHTPLLFHSLQQADAIKQLSASGQKKLKRFCQIIMAAHQQQQRSSLRRWIQGIWMSLGGPALLLDKNDVDNINTFLGLLDHYEQGGTILQWRDLEQAVNELYAKPTALTTDATDNRDSIPPVQIMTIHKSKGLEFDTVIIPALEKKPRGNDKELLLWLERIGYHPQTHQPQRQLVVSPVNATGDDKDPIYHFIQQQHTEKEQLEADRVLYVGCTRAIKQLHLLGYVSVKENDEKTTKNSNDSSTSSLTIDDIKEPAKHTLLQRLWPTINDNNQHLHIIPVDEHKHDGDISTANKLSHPNMIASLMENWQAPVIQANTLLEAYRGNNALAEKSVSRDNTEPQMDLLASLTVEDKAEERAQEKDNLAKPDELLQREQRYIGTIIHLALEQITRSGYQQWNESRIQQQHPIWKAQLAQQGISPLNLDKALNSVHKAVTHTLNDRTGQWLLDNTHTDSATELELWDKHGQHIIDRTFIEENSSRNKGKTTRWIIDYKSSQPVTGETLAAFTQRQLDEYQPQLQRYQQLFKNENLDIRAGLYFVLDGVFTPA